MMTYTPGPWKVETDSADDCNFWWYTVGPAQVSVGRHSDDDIEATANARLISAAPEMLEALDNLIRSNSPEHINAAIDAVAKARGKTNET
jgi:hypothetical protein